MKNDEKVRKIMKNQRKILENEEKVRKHEGKPMKNEGKVMENNEKVRKPCPRQKKTKQEKKTKKIRTLLQVAEMQHSSTLGCYQLILSIAAALYHVCLAKYQLPEEIFPGS